MSAAARANWPAPSGSWAMRNPATISPVSSNLPAAHPIITTVATAIITIIVAYLMGHLFLDLPA